MTELDRLVAQQKRDDVAYQDPQKFGGVRTVSFEKFVDAGRDGTDEELDTVRKSIPGAGSPRSHGGVAGPLPAWVPNRVHPIHRPRTPGQREALYRACEELLAAHITIEKRDAVRLVVYGQRSLRDAAAILGIHFTTVRQRIGYAFSQMRAVLAQRSGSEGRYFPPTRATVPGCKAPKCEGHFEQAVCEQDGCITILPRHYNPHTTCRVHTRGQTEAEFNQAFIIGAATRGGHEARSAAAPELAAAAS